MLKLKCVLNYWKKDHACRMFTPEIITLGTRTASFKQKWASDKISSADVKAKSAALRVHLGRKMAKAKQTSSGQCTDDLDTPSWVLWDQLHILLPVLQPGKSRDSLQASKSQETFDIMEEDHQEVDATRGKSTPRSSQCVKDEEKRKKELLSTFMTVHNKPQLSQHCHFQLYVSGKLHIFDKRTKSMVHSLSITNLCREMSIHPNIATLVMAFDKTAWSVYDKG